MTRLRFRNDAVAKTGARKLVKKHDLFFFFDLTKVSKLRLWHAKFSHRSSVIFTFE